MKGKLAKFLLLDLSTFLSIFILRIFTGKALSKKNQAVTKIMNMDIWLIGTLSQLFKRGSYT